MNLLKISILLLINPLKLKLVLMKYQINSAEKIKIIIFKYALKKIILINLLLYLIKKIKNSWQRIQLKKLLKE